MTKRVSGPQPMREAGSSGAAYPLLPPPSLPVGQWAGALSSTWDSLLAWHQGCCRGFLHGGGAEESLQVAHPWPQLPQEPQAGLGPHGSTQVLSWDTS